MKILTNSTPHDLWQQVIQEAQSICETSLQKDLELYLVFLLMRYMNKPEVLHQTVAPQLLQGLQQTPQDRDFMLQQVGDTCLLYSGLFPGLAEKRLVKINYFIRLGRGAYLTVSKTSDDIYSLLSEQFVAMMDILQSIRQYAKEFPDLLPMEAYDLWNESGSRRALRVLKLYSKSIPLNTFSTDDDSCVITLKKH